MNTNLKTPNSTFRFSAVVEFEIDHEKAAALLVESDPNKTVHQWLISQHPKDDYAFFGNVTELRTKLGDYEAEQAIARARALLPEGDVKLLPF